MRVLPSLSLGHFTNASTQRTMKPTRGTSISRDHALEKKACALQDAPSRDDHQGQQWGNNKGCNEPLGGAELTHGVLLLGATPADENALMDRLPYVAQCKNELLVSCGCQHLMTVVLGLCPTVYTYHGGNIVCRFRVR